MNSGWVCPCGVGPSQKMAGEGTSKCHRAGAQGQQVEGQYRREKEGWGKMMFNSGQPTFEGPVELTRK